LLVNVIMGWLAIVTLINAKGFPFKPFS
jgi:hypothetical protein